MILVKKKDYINNFQYQDGRKISYPTLLNEIKI